MLEERSDIPSITESSSPTSDYVIELDNASLAWSGAGNQDNQKDGLQNGPTSNGHVKKGVNISTVIKLVYWGLTPQQQPGSYQGGEMMMMKSVFWWRKPEYPEETTDLRLSKGYQKKSRKRNFECLPHNVG